MVSKPVGCLNDEPAEDDKTGEIGECGWWITMKSLWLATNFVQPVGTCNQCQPWNIG